MRWNISSHRTSLRTGRPSLNPYVLDEIAPTLTEIRRARDGQQNVAAETEVSTTLRLADVNERTNQIQKIAVPRTRRMENVRHPQRFGNYRR